MRRSWGTVSNAFVKSSMMTSTLFFWSIARVNYWVPFCFSFIPRVRLTCTVAMYTCLKGQPKIGMRLILPFQAGLSGGFVHSAICPSFVCLCHPLIARGPSQYFLVIPVYASFQTHSHPHMPWS